MRENPNPKTFDKVECCMTPNVPGGVGGVILEVVRVGEVEATLAVAALRNNKRM